MKTKPGRYYGVTHAGRMVPVGDVDRPPDVVICRRVADYPQARPPDGAIVTPCARCVTPIAWNPHGPHSSVSHICMQCGGIEPLPIEEA